MSFLELKRHLPFTWQLLLDEWPDLPEDHVTPQRRELTNARAREALYPLASMDWSQTSAELEAHMTQLSLNFGDQTLNDCVHDMCARSLGPIGELHRRPWARPAVEHLQGLLLHINSLFSIWECSIDGREFRRRLASGAMSDRRQARAANLQLCGHILIAVCKMSWPVLLDDMLLTRFLLGHWLEELEALFDKEPEDFVDAFFMDGPETLWRLLTGQGVAEQRRGRVLQVLKAQHHDGHSKLNDWVERTAALERDTEVAGSRSRRRRR